MKWKNEYRPFAPRRVPRVRFPFIIASVDQKATASPETLKSILEQNIENGTKISKLLKNMVYLESALDELLEGNHIEHAAGDELDMSGFFSELIPILDNLDRLRQAVMETGQEEWRDGMDIFHGKMMDLLKSRGFHASAAIGMAFDAARHEAVGATHDPHMPQGSIWEIIEPGWLYGNTVLRYAKVTVVKEKE